jgi:hypothetical protein
VAFTVTVMSRAPLTSKPSTSSPERSRE